MPYGKGTYGSKVGRPKKKDTDSFEKWEKSMKASKAGKKRSESLAEAMKKSKKSPFRKRKTGLKKPPIKAYRTLPDKIKKSKPSSTRKYFNNTYKEGE